MATWATMLSALVTTTKWRPTSSGNSSGMKPSNRCLARASTLSRVTITGTLLGISRVVVVVVVMGADVVLAAATAEEVVAGVATAVIKASTFGVLLGEREEPQGIHICRVA